MLKILNQTILIPWKRFEAGQSIFIPCLDRKAHEKELLAEAERLGIEVKSKQVVENGKFGLRLWRVK
jgi:hypothetical protein